MYISLSRVWCFVYLLLLSLCPFSLVPVPAFAHALFSLLPDPFLGILRPFTPFPRSPLPAPPPTFFSSRCP
ncbi:hypothetical protein GY45DRAFT_1327044 [Cubamyces sp. BRFM 1775]|nr:hypothetical protein GY45DRAFT_1327044 [Cubamyces sp. BRFM 1775]